MEFTNGKLKDTDYVQHAVFVSSKRIGKNINFTGDRMDIERYVFGFKSLRTLHCICDGI